MHFQMIANIYQIEFFNMFYIDFPLNSELNNIVIRTIIP